ncbi:MAG: PEGA domain-containing protein, partial [Acidobacteriota bacterium]
GPDLMVVDTDISPEDARVTLNGRLIGLADDFDGYPDYLYLEPGRYTIEFSLPGYRSESIEVEARRGRFLPLDTKLQTAPGEPSPRWYDRPKDLPVGRVFGPTGTTPSEPTGPDPSLRPDVQGGRQTGPSEGSDDELKSVSAIELRIEPEIASVYLDGEFLGTAAELSRLERGIAVTPGTHRLDVLAPGHAARSLEVEVAKGERRQVVVALDRVLDKPNSGY